jgi:hypothetical protein
MGRSPHSLVSNITPVKQIHFTSTLAAEYRDDLEDLLFFNPDQPKFIQAIEKSVARYGSPRIVTHGNGLRVEVGTAHQVQALFALQPRLVGCVIFVRDPIDNLTILHVVVADDKRMTTTTSEVPLVAQLYGQVTEIARRIKGINTVTILYRQSKTIAVSVN